MSRRLQRITDWEARVHAANYCVQTLAGNCDVSARTLERHIRLVFGKCPQEWLRRLLMQRAMELLPESPSVKDVALTLGYKHTHHFSRDFKKHTGYSPSQFPAARITRV